MSVKLNAFLLVKLIGIKQNKIKIKDSIICEVLCLFLVELIQKLCLLCKSPNVIINPIKWPNVVINW